MTRQIQGTHRIDSQPIGGTRTTLPRADRRARGLRPALPPRLVIHMLVGALALLAVQVVIEPEAPAWGALFGRTSLAQSEKEPAAAPVSAPALATKPTGLFTTTRSASTEVADPAVFKPVQPKDAGAGSTVVGPSSAGPAAPAVRLWLGTTGQDAYLRAEPNRGKAPVGELKAGQAVEVRRWVAGEEVERENTTWAELADGRFVYSSTLRRAPLAGPPALPADAPTEGRWVDVNLFEQVATAYEGRTPVKTVVISTGRPGWDTPRGTFKVLRRVAKETMEGSTLIGQGPNGRGADYKVENVRFTQYFTQDGAAIHENYWRRPALFGMPGSHGCIGLLPADAAWFWEFAAVGTPLVIHE
jgi:lipoprotein-anchoring transpeptidase ErfK/SrfK